MPEHSQTQFHERLAQAESDRTLCEQTLDVWNERILRLETALRYYAEGRIWDHGEIAREALGDSS